MTPDDSAPRPDPSAAPSTSPAAGVRDPGRGPDAPSDLELRRAGRRITGALFGAQGLGSAGVIGMTTVATIVGADLSGRTSLAGLPHAVYLLGTALAALPWSLATDALGRRGGLALGGLVGAIGATGAVAAFYVGSFPLLLIALLVTGSGQAAFRLGRFAAAEATPLARRGRAVATVVMAGAVGSVLGPQLLPRGGRIAEALGADPLIAAYGIAAVFFVLAAGVLALFLRPDPRVIARHLDALDPEPSSRRPARRLREISRDAGVIDAVLAMMVAQGGMVLIMAITPLYMRDLEHPLTAISLVFSAHTLGMFGFSLLTGWLVDRWGRIVMIRLGSAIVAVSCLMAPLSTAVGPIVVALFLLGLGWNIAFVGGSALLSDRLGLRERGRIQGINDLLVGFAGASASIGGAVVYAGAGYGPLAIGGAVAAALLLLATWLRRGLQEPIPRG